MAIEDREGDVPLGPVGYVVWLENCPLPYLRNIPTLHTSLLVTAISDRLSLLKSATTIQYGLDMTPVE